MTDLPRDLVVGTMCHCGEPDDCDDHWEFFTNVTPGYSSPEAVARGRHLTKAQMDAIAALVQREVKILETEEDRRFDNFDGAL